MPQVTYHFSAVSDSTSAASIKRTKAVLSQSTAFCYVVCYSAFFAVLVAPPALVYAYLLDEHPVFRWLMTLVAYAIGMISIHLARFVYFLTTHNRKSQE